MQSKKITQLATELNPTINDLTFTGNASTGQLKKISWGQLYTLLAQNVNLQVVTNNGNTTTNSIIAGGLTLTGFSTGVLKSTNGVISSIGLGTANGVATLDGGGKVPSTQLPSYVDDVLEYANLAALPASGETGKIYITLDSNKVYRWSGSVYVEISSSNGVWGSITGTLTNQTDLKDALDAKYSTTNPAGYQTASGRVDGSLKLWAESHPVDYYVKANWTGSYWRLTSNHPSGVQVEYSDSTGSVAWSNVTGKPTKLSEFTNDLGNYGGWITGITSTMVTNALGYTPYNSSNPAGYITSAALSGYMPISGGTFTGYVKSPMQIIVQTGSFTLTAGHESSLIEMDNTAQVYVTIPNDSTYNFAIGTEITFVAKTGSAVYFTPASGVTMRSLSGLNVINGQYVGVSLVKRGANDWYLLGNLRN